MLIREAHRRAADLGYGLSLLVGHKDYYPRFGYKRASSFGIEFPLEAPGECCMVAELQEDSLNPNRSLDTPSPFLIGKMRHSGILPASVRILFLATPRRSPLRLRLGEKHAA